MVRLGYSTIPTNGLSTTQPQCCWLKVQHPSRIVLFTIGLFCGATLSVTFFSALRQSRVSYRDDNDIYLARRKFLEHQGHTAAVDNKETHSKNETFHKDEDLLAQEISARVRVLCLIITKKDTFEKNGAAVNSTWGPRCNTLLFVSNFEDSKLPVVNVLLGSDSFKPWGLTKAALKYVYEHHLNAFDWLLRADDDTFVVVENLRYLLSSYNPSDTHYFGCRFKRDLQQGYMHGGAGYVLSKEAVKKTITEGFLKNSCDDADEKEEDKAMGRCQEKLNVSAMDTRDSLGRGRFFPFPPDQLLIPGVIKPDNPYWTDVYYPAISGFDCCSDTAISFHGIGANRMQVLNYLVYHLRPYGINSRLSFNRTMSIFST